LPLQYDAVIIGSGPNGLAAGIRLAQKRLNVKIIEAKNTPGGGMRTLELTLPGFKHDICSAIHPLGFASPFFKTLPLDKYGLEWIHPPVSVAHPFDDGTAVFASTSPDESAECLGPDFNKYKKVFYPLIKNWELIDKNILGPFRFPPHPLAAAGFGLKAMQSAAGFAGLFSSEKTRGFLLGLAAHGILPLDNIMTSAAGIVLTIYAHKYGWPFPEGGTQSLADALTAYFKSLGGEIECGMIVNNMNQLPPAKAYLFDVTPRQLINITGKRFPASYVRRLSKFKYGPGVFKIDYALDDAIPWKSEACKRTAAVHLGSLPGEIIRSEKNVWEGSLYYRPFVILAQQSLFDKTRAPAGRHTAWAYCHVPHGYKGDAAQLINNQVERFAPGFKKIILSMHIITPAEFEKYNPNYIGGDINGGAQTWDQLFTRPVWSFTPYRTPAKGIYICSSSAPPGGGVHGMCGYHAANTVIKDLFI
jgi:phytoene dehydrogenase-like protein